MQIDLKFHCKTLNNDKKIIKKTVSFDDIISNDLTKIFSVSDLKLNQSITVFGFELNDRPYEDFYDFCTFKTVDGKLLKKQNVICFNGDFYFDSSNKSKIKYFSTYFSNKKNDFVYWNSFIDCENIYGCLTGETPHINSWSNVPYNIKQLKKYDTIDIGCFGCSVTYGHGVDKKNIWPSLLKTENNTIGNFGTSAGGVDTIFINFKNSLEEFDLKKAVFVLPNLDRRLMILEQDGQFFRIPITINTDINAIYPNIWFSKEYFEENIKRTQELIIKDKDNEYSKKILEDLLELLYDRNIPFLISSWDLDCYELLKKIVKTDNLLTFFDRIDVGLDNKHHGPNSHKKWVLDNEKNLKFSKLVA